MSEMMNNMKSGLERFVNAILGTSCEKCRYYDVVAWQQVCTAREKEKQLCKGIYHGGFKLPKVYPASKNQKVENKPSRNRVIETAEQTLCLDNIEFYSTRIENMRKLPIEKRQCEQLYKDDLILRYWKYRYKNEKEHPFLNQYGERIKKY